MLHSRGSTKAVCYQVYCLDFIRAHASKQCERQTWTMPFYLTRSTSGALSTLGIACKTATLGQLFPNFIGLAWLLNSYLLARQNFLWYIFWSGYCNWYEQLLVHGGVKIERRLFCEPLSIIKPPQVCFHFESCHERRALSSCSHTPCKSVDLSSGLIQGT